jgi:hypothetical protein
MLADSSEQTSVITDMKYSSLNVKLSMEIAETYHT